MKKGYIILIISIALAMGYALWYFSSSHSTSYQNVNSYIEENEELYIDLYCPESYFDNRLKKETVKERNYIEVFYQGDPKDNYNVSFDINNIDIIYWINKNKDTYPLNEYESIYKDNYELYYSSKESSIVAVLENKLVCIELRNSDTEQRDILIDIMTDSLEMN